MAFDGREVNAKYKYEDALIGQVQQPSTAMLYENRGIGWAVKNMNHGLKVRRRGWNGRGILRGRNSLGFPTPTAPTW